MCFHACMHTCNGWTDWVCVHGGLGSSLRLMTDSCPGGRAHLAVPGTLSPFPSHCKILAPLLHFILNVDFKWKQECCILICVNSFEAELTILIQTSHFQGNILLWISRLSMCFLIHFCPEWRAGFIISDCQGRQCACQADMTQTTITFKQGRFLFHNLTLHVSQGVSSQGRVFSNHETYFPCCGVECIWRSEP